VQPHILHFTQNIIKMNKLTMGEWIMYRATERWWNSNQNFSGNFCKDRDYLEGQFLHVSEIKSILKSVRLFQIIKIMLFWVWRRVIWYTGTDVLKQPDAWIFNLETLYMDCIHYSCSLSYKVNSPQNVINCFLFSISSIL